MKEHSLVSGLREVVLLTDAEETERLQMESTLRTSRNEIQSTDEDLQRCLVASLLEFSESKSSESVLSPAADLDEVQEELLKSVAAQSEREFIESALEKSIPIPTESAMVMYERESLESKAQEVGDSVTRALELSNLTEEEAFELAMKMSRDCTGYSENKDAENSNIMTSEYSDDEDAMLQAALNESLMYNRRETLNRK
jgi:hypothetical protein